MFCLLNVLFFNLMADENKKEDLFMKLEKDPAILKILKNLKSNESIYLPHVKTAGNMNNAEVKKYKMDKSGPAPRDYCLKWVWSPERKRALFCGGNAGVPHKINDVWEYDLASNTWVLLWEPDPDTNRVRHMKKPGESKAYLDKFVKLDEESGEIMTKRGAPFDPVHTWWGITYDHEMKALLWVQGNHHLHGKFLKQHPELKDKYKLGGFHKMRLFAYYPSKNEWKFMPNKDAPNKSPAAILEYIPDLKGSLFYTNTHAKQGVLNSKELTWKTTRLSSSKTRLNKEHPECPGSEAVSAYDTENKVLVVQIGGGTRKGKPVKKRTHHYDVKTSKWTKVISSDEGPYAHDARSPMVYDSVAKVCLLIEPNAIWSYAVGDKKWKKLSPVGDQLSLPNARRNRPFMACYNAEYNVIMAYNGRGKVWVYKTKERK